MFWSLLLLDPPPTHTYTHTHTHAFAANAGCAGGEGAIAMGGSTKGQIDHPRKCTTDLDKKLGARCCANVDLPTCVRCPAGTNSDAGTTSGKNACKCDNDQVRDDNGDCVVPAAPTSSPTPSPTMPDCPKNDYLAGSASSQCSFSCTKTHHP